MRPLIGMTCRMDTAKHTHYLDDAYARAVYRCGGDPFLIPLIDDTGYIRRVAHGLHGILLPGSDSDVDPRRYHQSPHESLGASNPLRDQADATLLDIGFSQSIPILAVCYGIQILNVQLGGTLIQDIPSFLDTELRHDSQTDSEPPPTHPIIRGKTAALLEELTQEKKPIVNSAHHQALDEVSPQLEILAWAPDGVVEAVQLKDADHFVLGVQWHPELTFEQDRFSRAIFQKFLEHAELAACPM